MKSFFQRLPVQANARQTPGAEYDNPNIGYNILFIPTIFIFAPFWIMGQAPETQPASFKEVPLAHAERYGEATTPTVH